MDISVKKLYCISVYEPCDHLGRRGGMRVHVVADDHNQATEKAQMFFNKRKIPTGGLHEISTISSQCVV